MRHAFHMKHNLKQITIKVIIYITLKYNFPHMYQMHIQTVYNGIILSITESQFSGDSTKKCMCYIPNMPYIKVCR